VARTDATKLRIALAQVNPSVGDIEANLAKISQLYAASEAAGCDIVMFPELSITGYPPEDLASLVTSANGGGVPGAGAGGRAAGAAAGAAGPAAAAAVGAGA
jgi:predicted amidohydrolase